MSTNEGQEASGTFVEISVDVVLKQRNVTVSIPRALYEAIKTRMDDGNEPTRAQQDAIFFFVDWRGVGESGTPELDDLELP